MAWTSVLARGIYNTCGASKGLLPQTGRATGCPRLGKHHLVAWLRTSKGGGGIYFSRSTAFDGLHLQKNGSEAAHARIQGKTRILPYEAGETVLRWSPRLRRPAMGQFDEARSKLQRRQPRGVCFKQRNAKPHREADWLSGPELAFKNSGWRAALGVGLG